MTDLGNGLYAVSVPADARELQIVSDSVFYNSDYPENGIVDFIEVGDNFELLGTVTTSDIDFDVEPFVQKRTLGYWLDYTKPNTRHDYMCDTPKDSFRSLLSSKGLYFENPLGDIRPVMSMCANKKDCIKMRAEWDHFEINLIQKLVILKKITSQTT